MTNPEEVVKYIQTCQRVLGQLNQRPNAHPAFDRYLNILTTLHDEIVQDNEQTNQLGPRV